MSKKNLVLRFEKEFLKQYTIDTGEILESSQRYSLELCDFSPEERAQILEVEEDDYIRADRVPQTREDWMALIRAHLERVRLEANRQVEEYMANEKKLIQEAMYRLNSKEDPPWFFAVKRADKGLLAALQERWAWAKQRAREIRDEEKQKEEAQRKAQEEREQAQRKAREEWILAHGSERLRKISQMGYSCTGLFEKEFAAFHFPAATHDWHRKSRWEERRCPSLKALQRVEEYAQRFPEFGFEVVWLTAPPRGFGMDEMEYVLLRGEFKPCEAIKVEIPEFSGSIIEEVV